MNYQYTLKRFGLFLLTYTAIGALFEWREIYMAGVVGWEMVRMFAFAAVVLSVVSTIIFPASFRFNSELQKQFPNIPPMRARFYILSVVAALLILWALFGAKIVHYL